MNKTNNRREKKPDHNLNEWIRSSQVRLVGNEDENLNGVMPTSKALSLAKELGLDLVEINGTTNPPICKIIEYSKFKYELKKKEQENKKKNKTAEQKEIRLGPNIGENDYQVKFKQAREFLTDGHKVKAVMLFRGREIAFKDNGQKILLQLATDLEKEGRPDDMPKLEGKKMFISFSPKK